jgi:hypothetical protein
LKSTRPHRHTGSHLLFSIGVAHCENTPALLTSTEVLVVVVDRLLTLILIVVVGYESNSLILFVIVILFYMKVWITMNIYFIFILSVRVDFMFVIKIIY